MRDEQELEAYKSKLSRFDLLETESEQVCGR